MRRECICNKNRARRARSLCLTTTIALSPSAGKAFGFVKVLALIAAVALNGVLLAYVLAARGSWHADALKLCREQLVGDDAWIMDERGSCTDPSAYDGGEYAVADLLQGVVQCDCTAIDASGRNLTELPGALTAGGFPHLATVNASDNALVMVPGVDEWRAQTSLHTLELAGNDDPRLLEDEAGLLSLLRQTPSDGWSRHPGVVEAMLDSAQVAGLLRHHPAVAATISTLGLRLNVQRAEFPDAVAFLEALQPSLQLLVVEASDSLLAHLGAATNTTAAAAARAVVPATVTGQLCSRAASKRGTRCEGNALPGWSLASTCVELDPELGECDEEADCGCLFGRGMPRPLCGCSMQHNCYLGDCDVYTMRFALPTQLGALTGLTTLQVWQRSKGGRRSFRTQC